MQTDRALNQSDTAMQSHGCYFRACQAVAERYAGKRLSADDIKSSREALTKSGAIGQGDYALNVNNPDQVINDAFERLGVKKTATVGYGGKPDQKRDFTIVAGHTEFPSGAAGDHKRLGDANGNEIWDPAPGGKKSSSRTIDVFLHDKK